jgi:hypothetical protein
VEVRTSGSRWSPLILLESCQACGAVTHLEIGDTVLDDRAKHAAWHQARDSRG